MSPVRATFVMGTREAIQALTRRLARRFREDTHAHYAGEFAGRGRTRRGGRDTEQVLDMMGRDQMRDAVKRLAPSGIRDQSEKGMRDFLSVYSSDQILGTGKGADRPPKVYKLSGKIHSVPTHLANAHADFLSTFAADTSGSHQDAKRELHGAAKSPKELHRALGEWARLTPAQRDGFFGENSSKIFKTANRRAPTMSRLMKRIY